MVFAVVVFLLAAVYIVRRGGSLDFGGIRESILELLCLAGSEARFLGKRLGLLGVGDLDDRGARVWARHVGTLIDWSSLRIVRLE